MQDFVHQPYSAIGGFLGALVCVTKFGVNYIATIRLTTRGYHVILTMPTLNVHYKKEKPEWGVEPLGFQGLAPKAYYRSLNS